MEIIPVIDVAGGEVVAAKRGDRARYKPLLTPLAASSDPAAVAKGLAGLYPFRKFYIADLDGITGHGRNVHLVPALSRALPQTELWIDAGTASRGAARALLAAPVTTLVIGTETLETAAVVKEMLLEAPQRTVLSLDFRGNEFLGPQQLLDDASLWPDRVIAMTMSRVGSGEGPDVARIGDIVHRAGKRRVYAAGGIRDAGDIEAVRKAGAAGALIASALHSGKITAGDLKEIAGR